MNKKIQKSIINFFKKTFATGLLIILVLAVFFSIGFVNEKVDKGDDSENGSENQEILVFDDRQYQLAEISINDVPIDDLKIILADDNEKHARGMAIFDAPQQEYGMYFDYPTLGTRGFWMKDMKMALDIIWIAGDGTIIHIERGVQPQTFPQIFGGEFKAEDVLELPAGFAEKFGIEIGVDKINI